MNANYAENPEVEDFPDFKLVYQRFKDTGTLKSPEQIKMYEAISRVWCVGKTVADLGCGMGIGTNILAREAIGVFGCDRDARNISAAEQLFGNQRIKFGVEDLAKGFSRPVAPVDVVCLIEVIEHVKDYNAVLNTVKSLYERKRNTVFFISSPNRNNPKIKEDGPRNYHHVREWNAGEFYEVLTKHFQYVVMYSSTNIQDFNASETVDLDSIHTPILAKCENPINTNLQADL